MLNICFNKSQHIYAYKRCAYIKKDYQDKVFLFLDCDSSVLNCSGGRSGRESGKLLKFY